jgi:hypothetical protein
MGVAEEPARDNSTPAKAAAGHSRQKQDLTKGRSDQGVTAEYPLNTLANPLHKSLIRPEAWGLHALGALARTHMSQVEGDLSPVASIITRGRARQRNPLCESLIRPNAQGL